MERKIQDDEEEYKKEINHDKKEHVLAKQQQTRGLQKDELGKICAQRKARPQTQIEIEEVNKAIDELKEERRLVGEMIESKIKMSSLCFDALQQLGEILGTGEVKLKIADGTVMQADVLEEEEGAVPMVED